MGKMAATTPLTRAQMDDLNRMYGILNRNGVQETARLLGMAVAQMAKTMPSYAYLTDGQRATLHNQMILAAGRMVAEGDVAR